MSSGELLLAQLFGLFQNTRQLFGIDQHLFESNANLLLGRIAVQQAQLPARKNIANHLDITFK